MIINETDSLTSCELLEDKNAPFSSPVPGTVPTTGKESDSWSWVREGIFKNLDCNLMKDSEPEPPARPVWLAKIAVVWRLKGIGGSAS